MWTQHRYYARKSIKRKNSKDKYEKILNFSLFMQNYLFAFQVALKERESNCIQKISFRYRVVRYSMPEKFIGWLEWGLKEAETKWRCGKNENESLGRPFVLPKFESSVKFLQPSHSLDYFQPEKLKCSQIANRNLTKKKSWGVRINQR